MIFWTMVGRSKPWQAFFHCSRSSWSRATAARAAASFGLRGSIFGALETREILENAF
jgi:hypothetical protein